MQEYISKQQQIHHSAARIFPLISNFSLLTPAVADKVEEWQATEDSCSFKFKGFTVALCMVDKVENNMSKSRVMAVRCLWTSRSGYSCTRCRSAIHA